MRRVERAPITPKVRVNLIALVRVCTKCGALKPRSEASYAHSWCRACLSQAGRTRRAADPERFKRESRERAAALRAAEPERVRAYMAAYQAGHPENRRAYNRKWYAANRTSRTESIRVWQRANPEKLKMAQRKLRAKRNAAPGHTTAEQLRARVEYYGSRCAYCGGPYEEIDHVIPLSRGGSDWPANLRPACTPCNGRKSAMPAKEWLKCG